MKVIKSVVMFGVMAGICGSCAYASVHASSVPDSTTFAVAGFVLIGLSSVLRRRSRRGL